MVKKFIGIARTTSAAAQPGYVDIYKPFFTSNDRYMMHPNYDQASYAKQLTGVPYGSEFNAYDTANYSPTQTVPDIVGNVAAMQADGASFIGYDVELSNSPTVENSNRTTYIPLAATAAHSHGMVLEIAPGIPGLPISEATNLTPLLSNGDIFVIQGETAVPDGQTDFDISPFVSKIRPFATEIKRINPNVLAIAEVSTTPGGPGTTLAMLQQCWMAVADLCDGVACWNSGVTGGDPLLRQFVSWFCRCAKNR